MQFNKMHVLCIIAQWFGTFRKQGGKVLQQVIQRPIADLIYALSVLHGCKVCKLQRAMVGGLFAELRFTGSTYSLRRVSVSEYIVHI